MEKWVETKWPKVLRARRHRIALSGRGGYPSRRIVSYCVYRVEGDPSPMTFTVAAHARRRVDFLDAIARVEEEKERGSNE